jgi:FkbM family methyltransferase
MNENDVIIPNNENNWYFMVTQECMGYPLPPEPIRNCLDIGCNVGGFVNAWNHRIEKFYCVDASGYNIDEASRNMKSLLDSKRAFLLHMAVHSKSDDILYLRPYMSANGAVNSGSFGTTGFVYEDGINGWRETDIKEEVTTISFEELFEDATSFFETEEIDLLKIDVEGAEYDFLIDKDLSKINYIVGEIHNFLDKMESNQEGINRVQALHSHISKTHTLEYIRGDGMDSHYNVLYKRKNKNI